MIWKETGVLKDSYMSYFNPSVLFREYFTYMVSCGSFHCDDRYSVKKDGSRHPIFFYITEGELNFAYEGQHFSAKQNEIVILNGYKPHHYFCQSSCEFLFFHFDGAQVPALIDRLISDNGSPLFRLESAREILEKINEPITRLCHQERASDAMLSSIVYSVLCMIPVSGTSSNLYIPSRMQISPDMMSYRVIEYVDQHIDRNYTIQELADYAGLSRYYFMRRFRQETGYTPQEYIAVAKINYSKLMLRTTALTVSEISERLGYSSPASFINAFRARRGIPPNQYRKLYARKQPPAAPLSAAEGAR